MIYQARYVLPITSPPVCDGQVLVRLDRIEAVGTNLRESHPKEPVRDLGEAILMPGFVNSHAHLDFTALRGSVDDLPFFQWIRKIAERARALEAEDVKWASLLGAAECIQAGITTLADASFSGASLDALFESGLRGIVYQEVFGYRTDDFAPELDALRRQLDDLGSKADDRVRMGVSPHSVYTVSEKLLGQVRDLARQLDLPMSIHVAESPSEHEFCVSGKGEIARLYKSVGIDWQCPGVSPVQYLYDLGLLGERTLAAHCVHVNQDDIRLLAVSRTGVAHCPKSNTKLSVGLAPIPQMMEVGVRLGLGTDSAASSNSLDICEEARFAALLQRIKPGAPSVVKPEKLIEAATMGGAKALGMDSEIGSLEAGKKADLAVIDISKARLFPDRDPYSLLVYGASAGDVLFTMVDGQVLYEQQELKTLDLAEIKRKVLDHCAETEQ